MSNDYLDQFTYENLEELLLSRTEGVNRLIELGMLKAERIYDLHGTPDYVPMLTKVELDRTFQEVKNEVDSFLDIQDIEPPSCGYFGLLERMVHSNTFIMASYALSAMSLISGLINVAYNSGGQLHLLMGAILGIGAYYINKHPLQSCYLKKQNKILLERRSRVEIIPAIAHEYAHHLLNKHFDIGLKGSYRTFEEGFASGIEKYIAVLYARRENNSAFLGHILTTFLYEFMASWVFQKIGEWKPEAYKIRAYIVGTTMFQLWEAKIGEGIYKDIVHKRFTPV